MIQEDFNSKSSTSSLFFILLCCFFFLFTLRFLSDYLLLLGCLESFSTPHPREQHFHINPPQFQDLAFMLIPRSTKKLRHDFQYTFTSHQTWKPNEMERRLLCFFTSSASSTGEQGCSTVFSTFRSFPWSLNFSSGTGGGKIFVTWWVDTKSWLGDLVELWWILTGISFPFFVVEIQAFHWKSYVSSGIMKQPSIVIVLQMIQPT